jgi:hypothetical protein
LIEFARTLRDQPDADAELAPLRKYLLENVGGDDRLPGGREAVRLFQQREDG